MNKRWLCVALLLVMLPGVAGAYDWTMSANHPRILMTPTMLDSAKVRVLREPYKTWYDQALTLTANSISSALYQNDQRLITAAFCYAVSDSAAILSYIEDVLTARTTVGHAAYKYLMGSGTGAGFVPGCTQGVPIAMDWCYDALDTDVKAAVFDLLADFGLGGTADGVYATTVPTSLGGIPQLCGCCDGGGCYLPVALTLYGEGYIDSIAAATVDAERTRFYTMWAPAMDEISLHGAVEGYVGARWFAIFGTAEMIRTALSEDAAASCGYITNANAYWLHRYEPDMWFMRNVAKWNVSYQPRMMYASIFQGHLTNSNSGFWGTIVGILNSHFGQTWPTGTNTPASSGDGWASILYYDDSIAATDPPDSLSYYDPTGSLVFSRSGWSFGDTSTAIVSSISAMPRIADGYRVGHFNISRGDDLLITNSGQYFSSEYEDNYRNYMMTALARNTIGIDDPEELSEWPDRLEGEQSYANYWGGTLVIPNDGNQNYPDADSAEVKWPIGAWSDTGPTGVQYGYLGEIVDFEDTGDYLYTRLDITHAYRFKASRVLREFMHVRPNVFIVRDLITRDDVGYWVKSRVHCIERPEPTLDQCPARVEHGSPWSADLGGVYKFGWDREFTITRGDSEALLFILKPACGRGTVKVIGGPNSSGESWKQDWHTQITNPLLIGETSYEFWVEHPDGTGKNYVPGVAGTTQPYITNRNVRGAYSKQSYAADWRVDVQAQDTGLDVEIITAFVVGASGQESATAVYHNTDSSVVVTITQGDIEVNANFATSGGCYGATRD